MAANTLYDIPIVVGPLQGVDELFGDASAQQEFPGVRPIDSEGHVLVKDVPVEAIPEEDVMTTKITKVVRG